MGIPFATRSVATALVFVGDSERQFAVDIRFECAGAVERDTRGHDGMPVFDLQFRASAIIQPAVGDAALLTGALQMTPALILVAGSDGCGYEITVNVKILRAVIGPQIDLSSNMPIPTVEFQPGPTTTRRTLELSDGVFTCVYCGHEHAKHFASREHIIPEALFNRNYVLPQVCKRRNNYFAHAFENRLLRLSSIEELRLMFNPPNKAVFCGTLTAADGTTFKRFALPNGGTEIGSCKVFGVWAT